MINHLLNCILEESIDRITDIFWKKNETVNILFFKHLNHRFDMDMF